jgi:aspartate carbamoyltransferase catalytic subunit
MPTRHLLGVADLDRDQVLSLLESAAREDAGVGAPLQPATAGLIFLEESTRTRAGFEVAAARLGGQAVVVTAVKHTQAMSAGESWADTVRSIGHYFDVLCIRHPDPAAPRRASELVDVPVVNCGNGADEHPTQALIDLLAIVDHLGRGPDGVRVAMVGDLRNMRAAHSLILALALFDGVRVVAVSPPELGFPPPYADRFEAAGHQLSYADSLDTAMEVDVVYMAGFAPTTPIGVWHDAARDPFRLTLARAQRLPSAAAVLCPLPRIDEIEAEVDDLPQARYFRQSRLGLAMRTAILRHVLP